MSSGWPIRPRGVCSTIESRIFWGIERRISVATKPGATAFTRILYLPSSRAHVRVMPMTPAFVAT